MISVRQGLWGLSCLAAALSSASAQEEDGGSGSGSGCISVMDNNNIRDAFLEEGLEYCDMEEWDTGAVTDMSELFFHMYEGLTLDADLSNWDTSSVTNMNHMCSML